MESTKPTVILPFKVTMSATVCFAIELVDLNSETGFRLIGKWGHC